MCHVNSTVLLLKVVWFILGAQKSALKQLCGGTIFVDHATNCVFNNYQANLFSVTTAENTHKCKPKSNESNVQTN